MDVELSTQYSDISTSAGWIVNYMTHGTGQMTRDTRLTEARHVTRW